MGKILSSPCTVEHTPDGGLRFVPTQPIPTRDAATIRTHDPEGLPMNFRDEHMRSRRTGDDIMTGNDPSPKRIALGKVYTATAEELRDLVTDPVTPLQPGRNFVLGEILGPEDVSDYEGENGPGPVINLGHAYPQGVKDALTRARAGRGRDQGPRPLPGMEEPDRLGTTFRPGTQQAEAEEYWRRSDGPLKGVNPTPDSDAPDLAPHQKKPTRDGRAMARVRNYLPGTNSGITAQQYQDNLREGRAKMATQDQSPPAPKARVTAAEFAALHAKKRAV
jgi:hypothetical protein